MKKLYTLLFLSVATCYGLFAQAPVTFTVEVPEGTTTVRMRGEFWAWDPIGGPEAISNGLDNTWSVTLWSDNGTREAFEYDWYVDGAFETVPTGCTGRVQGVNINDYGGGVNRKYDPTQTSVNEIVNSCYIATEALELKGITDFTTPAFGSSGKAVHLYATDDIANLSVYGLESNNNGAASVAREYTFDAIAVAAGEHIIVLRDQVAYSTYLEGLDQFDHVFVDAPGDAVNGNGNDAYVLWKDDGGDTAIEMYGDPADVTGGSSDHNASWDYQDAYSYKELNVWSLPVQNCSDGSTTTFDSDCPYPFATQTLSTNDFDKSELSIYPNPVNEGLVSIKSQLSGVKNIELYDMLGRSVLNTTLNSDVLDVRSINNGLYLLKVSIEDRSSITKLIIK